jgi:hypothetical protein
VMKELLGSTLPAPAGGGQPCRPLPGPVDNSETTFQKSAPPRWASTGFIRNYLPTVAVPRLPGPDFKAVATWCRLADGIQGRTGSDGQAGAAQVPRPLPGATARTRPIGLPFV